MSFQKQLSSDVGLRCESCCFMKASGSWPAAGSGTPAPLHFSCSAVGHTGTQIINRNQEDQLCCSKGVVAEQPCEVSATRAVLGICEKWLSCLTRLTNHSSKLLNTITAEMCQEALPIHRCHPLSRYRAVLEIVRVHALLLPSISASVTAS